jgi:hypothetical protein
MRALGAVSGWDEPTDNSKALSYHAIGAVISGPLAYGKVLHRMRLKHTAAFLTCRSQPALLGVKSIQGEQGEEARGEGGDVQRDSPSGASSKAAQGGEAYRGSRERKQPGVGYSESHLLWQKRSLPWCFALASGLSHLIHVSVRCECDGEVTPCRDLPHRHAIQIALDAARNRVQGVQGDN